MNTALDGKTALVIGAGRSLGRALSLALAGAGAAVAAQDLSPVGLDATADAVRAAGGSIRAYCGETGKGLPAGALMDEVLNDFQRIDLFFHCAWAHPIAGLLELDEWDWQRAFETNVTSPYLLLRLVGRHMQDLHGGAAGIFAVDAARPPVFAASQAARLALVRAAAAEFSAYNISVFAICLGDHQSISGEATVPPGDETLALARAVRLALQLAGSPTLPRQIVYRPNADPKPSSPE
ncbi:dehydrogenase [Longilinea arvoryzae]|uniref:Dehydrogenase n=1 Tax=Longilinea arvoryzae TaxID=360412 RepID=A0A0S7BFK9_9CHLR|nr:SDR family NAD(P)-dependent oxidoreductase [Longilinea arvoryzae]GAP12561.1 dehydrogenase [Longilinea arvoryzae]